MIEYMCVVMMCIFIDFIYVKGKYVIKMCLFWCINLEYYWNCNVINFLDLFYQEIYFCV